MRCKQLKVPFGLRDRGGYCNVCVLFPNEEQPDIKYGEGQINFIPAIRVSEKRLVDFIFKDEYGCIKPDKFQHNDDNSWTLTFIFKEEDDKDFNRVKECCRNLFVYVLLEDK